MNAIRVRDLKEQRSIKKRNGRLFVIPQPFLYCRRCGAEYSAHAGDYWYARPDDVFRCCRVNMIRVKRHTVLTLV